MVWYIKNRKYVSHWEIVKERMWLILIGFLLGLVFNCHIIGRN